MDVEEECDIFNFLTLQCKLQKKDGKICHKKFSNLSVKCANKCLH